ncbi:MAG TPA: SRPBCC domain-containing protein [Gaiellaceae bacterium]|jgi:uncharacterized protein YndB with AHSA1/START domain|nr:SRPBCC domain-containing protein [Gaiellaceae bacterium]
MTIEITKQIEAPRERVFRALTDAEELARWFPSSAESDARTGGNYVLRFEFEDGSRDHTYAGRYEEVMPPERVRYPWNGRFGDTTVEFTLRGSGSGTELFLRHSGWTAEAEEARRLHEEGWGFFLNNLERYVTTGQDERPSALQQKTEATAGAATGGGP